MTLRTLNYGNYGIFLIMGNAGFCPSTVRLLLYFSMVSVQDFGRSGIDPAERQNSSWGVVPESDLNPTLLKREFPKIGDPNLVP